MFGSDKSKEAVKGKDKHKKKQEKEDSSSDSERRSTKTSLMRSLWKGGVDKGKDGLIKGRQRLEQSLGLGKKPNQIPRGRPDIHGAFRTVYIGWHPVAGFAGTWFAEQTGLGRKITEKIHRYPDPTQHWAVLVGDYAHQLWMDESLHVIYNNERTDQEDWRTFEVGKTSFNDEALRQAAEMVIYNMRCKKPAYNLITNNCQNFAVMLLEAIQAGARREFATSYAIYKRAIGEGTVKELFEISPEEEAADAAVVAAQGGKTGVQNAEIVMQENTTVLDNHVPGRLHCC